MGRRYEQDLTRFDGRIDERAALAMGAYELVPTPLLVARLSKVASDIRQIHKPPLEMSINEFADTSHLIDEEIAIGHALQGRNPRKAARSRRQHTFRLGHVPGVHATPEEEPDSMRL
ncbi:hypothetical protein K2X83_01360 [Patescibacteria group bacterium]|nr:hypothetical protein [Patescibacteria group bacterium]